MNTTIKHLTEIGLLIRLLHTATCCNGFVCAMLRQSGTRINNEKTLEILHVFNSRKGNISAAISGVSQKGHRATSKGNCVPCRFHNVGGVASLTLTSLSPCKQLVKQSPQPFAMLRTQPQPHKTNNLHEETQSWTLQHNDLPFIHFQFVRAPGHIIQLVQHTVDHLWRLCWEMTSKLHSKTKRSWLTCSSLST